MIASIDSCVFVLTPDIKKYVDTSILYQAFTLCCAKLQALDVDTCGQRRYTISEQEANTSRFVQSSFSERTLQQVLVGRAYLKEISDIVLSKEHGRPCQTCVKKLINFVLKGKSGNKTLCDNY